MLASVFFVLGAGSAPEASAAEPELSTEGPRSVEDQEKEVDKARVEKYCKTFLENEGYQLPEVGQLTALRRAVFQPSVEPSVLDEKQQSQFNDMCWVLVMHEWVAFQQASGKLERQAAAARLRLATNRLVDLTRKDASYEATRRRLAADNFRQQSLNQTRVARELQPDQLRAKIAEEINSIINPASTHEVQSRLVTPIREAIKNTSEALAKAVQLEVRAVGTIGAIYGREAFKPGRTARHYEESISSLSSDEKKSLIEQFDKAKVQLEKSRLVPEKDEDVPNGDSIEYARLKRRLYLLSGAVQTSKLSTVASSSLDGPVVPNVPLSSSTEALTGAMNATANPTMDQERMEMNASRAAAEVDAVILQIVTADRQAFKESNAPDPFDTYFHTNEQDKQIAELFEALKRAGLTSRQMENSTSSVNLLTRAHGEDSYLLLFVTDSYAGIVSELFKGVEAGSGWWDQRIQALEASMESDAKVKQGTFAKDAPELSSSSAVDILLNTVNQKLPSKLQRSSSKPLTEMNNEPNDM